MKKTLLILFFLFSFSIQSQCFDCAKNLGGWNDDTITDLKKTNDGIYLFKSAYNFLNTVGLYKYDYNCNLIWKKEINKGSSDIFSKKLISDDQGNIYVLIS